MLLNANFSIDDKLFYNSNPDILLFFIHNMIEENM